MNPDNSKEPLIHRIVYTSSKADKDETFTGDIGVICGVDGNL